MEQLLIVLAKLDPDAATKTWHIKNFRTAVEKAKREYEIKDRLLRGTPQISFHKTIGTFGARANLFQLVPQQSNYTSLVTDAATILISVSDGIWSRSIPNR